MKVTVSWMGPEDTESSSNMSFMAHTESGHQVMMDGAPGDAIGGRNLAPRPMEMVLLLGTGGCNRLRRCADPAARPRGGFRM